MNESGSFLADMWSIAWQVAWLGLFALIVDLVCLRRAAPWLCELLWGVVLVRFLLPAELAFFDFGSDFLWRTSGLVQPWSIAGVAPSLSAWVIVAWAVGACVAAALGIQQYRRELSKLHIGSCPATPAWQATAAIVARRLRMRAEPRLRVTTSSGAPCVAGLWRPCVFVPAALPLSVSAADREHILLHEFAHLQRGDAWRSCAVLLVQIVFWFHPVAWLAASRLAFLRELAADGRAAAASGSGPAAYGATLLAFTQHLGPRGLAAGFAGRGRLARRIEALVSRRPVGARLGLSALACQILFACALALPATPIVPALLADALFADASLADAPDLPGCLQQRYLVFTAMAAAEQPALR